MRVLFVCTGNTCRSPMAEGIFNAKSKALGKDWEAKSAGVFAPEGFPASSEAVEVLKKEYRIDISDHRAKSLREEDLKGADLVLAMAFSHKRSLVSQYPEYADKIFTIKEFVGLEGDVEDPYGMPLEVYKKTAEELSGLIDKLIEKLSEERKVDRMIALGSDHAGYELKEVIKKYLEEKGIPYKDFGTFNEESVDYPDYALKVAEAVASGECTEGILVCGTGIGMSITANKVPGIRAAHVEDVFSAKAAKEHNNANILCMGGRVTGPGLAIMMVEEWLNATFQGGRHQKRIDKITEIEKKYMK
ncbi:MAG: Ribose 5-phosphate isomerase RpiB [Caldanaerobacter subterraneus]|uniref:Ribose 5-phosphate isomerase B n=2 Tax=Caldanaerobacter subterraneus TaxID=911092 RepID=A0A101E620_9THEO|nr:MAG: Ribose 5-phosphate isomerase RpiB [Caldanaerobacter subterraneus]HBT50453.1 ribose 5-phosphate isomerase B [Caldanaerobacter subterraneus]